jgi:hypothetical protein
MAEKQVYPMISEKSWWQIRNQFKKTIPSTVNVSYLKSLLSLNSDQSARNIITPLRQMGIIDTEGKPLPRATDWRSDAKYPEVCLAIVSEIYPQELQDLFPDSQIDSATAKSWFMDTCALGNAAAGKIMSTFILLKSGHIKTDTDIPKSSQASKKIKPSKETKNNVDQAKDEPIGSTKAPPSQTTNNISDKASPVPSVHIDLQIHISPDASPDQIDSIFASMAKHLYGRS